MIGLIDCRSRTSRYNWAGVPPSTLEFFDRPVLQHAVEQMFRGGVTHCVLITEDASGMMQRWRNGEDWGCTISAIPPHAITIFLAGLKDEALLVGRADCVPDVVDVIANHVAEGPTSLIFHEPLHEEAASCLFTGWAVTYPRTLLENCFATHGTDGLLKASDVHRAKVVTCIRTDSPDALLQSQAAVLALPPSQVTFHGAKRVDRVWTGRRVNLHPSVKISGSVFIGENVRIARGATIIGPVAICRDSVIEADSVVAAACVQPGMYVGRGTHLQHVVVVPGSILRARHGRVVKVTDPRVLVRAEMGMWRYLTLWSRTLWSRPA
jgi:carbonic anhydrase/acetyltransferase-like protein (isoleucine patch superfamily)